MKTSYFKCCAAPMCKNTSISSPQKLFIHVPKCSQTRRKWLILARRDPTSLRPTSTSHFCEDHFDLPNDMVNYAKYTTMGTVARIMMKPGCLPSKFACQFNNDSTSVGVGSAKRQQKNAELRDVCEEEINTDSSEQSDESSDEVLSQDEDPLNQEQDGDLSAAKKSSYYKWCAVPMCKSNSNSMPHKLFIHVPKNSQIRGKWLTLARKDPTSLTTTSTRHFCEDHFDLPNDMENYVEYTIMGKVSQIRMRPGCLPSKFTWQTARTRKLPKPRRPLKKKASTSKDGCLPAAKRQRQQSGKLSTDSSQNIDPQQERLTNIDEASCTESYSSAAVSKPSQISKLKAYKEPDPYRSRVACIEDQFVSDLSLYLLQRSVTL